MLRSGNDDGQRFVDAVVRMRGVCLAWDDPRRQFISLRMLGNDLDAITVTCVPPADPFVAVPAMQNDLLRYRSDGLNPCRVRLRGVVTWWRPGDLVAIQDAKFGARVNTDAHTRTARTHPGNSVSARQVEVLEPLAKGLSKNEIAAVLGVTIEGTKAHLRAILAKLGVDDRTEAVVTGIQRGWLREEGGESEHCKPPRVESRGWKIWHHRICGPEVRRFVTV